MPVPTLPTEERLAAAHTALMDVDEFHVSEIARAVFAVTNVEEGKEQEVTLAEIGALALFVRNARSQCEYMLKELTKIDEVLDELDGIRREGRMVDVPKYDEYGSLSAWGEIRARAKSA